MTDKKKGWVEGRVKESADGLRGRETSPEDHQRRIREAAEAQAKKAAEKKP